MPVPKIYHPFRKMLVRHIVISSVVGLITAEAYQRLYVTPKVERRNFVMSLIEKERIMKKDALDAAKAELTIPGQGSLEALFPEQA